METYINQFKTASEKIKKLTKFKQNLKLSHLNQTKQTIRDAEKIMTEIVNLKRTQKDTWNEKIYLIS